MEATYKIGQHGDECLNPLGNSPRTTGNHLTDEGNTRETETFLPRLYFQLLIQFRCPRYKWKISVQLLPPPSQGEKLWTDWPIVSYPFSANCFLQFTSFIITFLTNIWEAFLPASLDIKPKCLIDSLNWWLAHSIMILSFTRQRAKSSSPSLFTDMEYLFPYIVFFTILTNFSPDLDIGSPYWIISSILSLF